jgi:hypothetical protein
MSSNFNNAKIINVYYNKGDRKPYDVNGKPIAYIGQESVGATLATKIRFYLGEQLDSSTAVIVTKRPDGERRLDLCELVPDGVNSYYEVELNAWYGAVKGKATLVFKVYDGEVEFDDEENPTEILSTVGRIVVSDIFNLEIAYAPEADLIVPPDDSLPYQEWFAGLSTKLDKTQSIMVKSAPPTSGELAGNALNDRYFYVQTDGVGKLLYVDGSTLIEVIWGVGTLKLTSNGNEDITVGTNAGKMYWDSDRGTIIAGLYDDQEAGIGDSLFFFGKATEAIAKGEVVQFAGNTGGNIRIKKAVFAEISAQPDLLMGVAKHAIALNDFGYVVSFGYVRNLNTTAFTTPILYLSTSVDGALSSTKPTTGFKGSIAAVARPSTGGGSNGFLIVRPNLVKGIGDLADVTITTATSGQILSFDGSKWVNSNRLTTAETDIDNLEGRMTTAENDIDSLEGRMTSAEGDIDDIEDGTTIVPKALADQNGDVINTTYLKIASASATYIPLSQKGVANGVAPLGADNKILSIHLPGGVDDIKEFADVASFPDPGEASIIYVALDTNLIYRWSGTAYVEISSSLALGQTSSTAFPGDRGLALETLTDNIVDGSQALALKDQIIRNTLTTTIPLVVNGLASTTANLTEFQVDGVKKLEVTKDGFLNQNGVRLFHQRADASNIFFGLAGGNLSLTGTENNGFGLRSLNALSSGSFNTGFGGETGRSITTGSANTFIGIYAGFNASQLATASNSTAIGGSSFTDKSNQMVFGNASVTEFKFDRNASATILAPNLTIGGTLNTIGISFTGGTQDTSLYKNATDSSLRYYSTSGGVGADRLTILPNGNVGIGTASPAQRLSVLENISVFRSASTGFARLFYNTDTTINFTVGLRSNVSDYSIQNELLNSTALVVLGSNNNVGIGTSSPASKLEVVGSSFPVISAERTTTLTNVLVGATSIKATTSADMVDGFGMSQVFQIRDNAGVDNIVGVLGVRRSGADNSGRMVFETTNAGTQTEKMTIMPDGKVGIGTNNPLEQLHLQNTVSVASYIKTTGSTSYANYILEAGRTYNFGTAGAGETTGLANKFYIRDSTANAQRLIIDSSGLVGINETSPSAQLQVKSGATNRVPLIVDTLASHATDIVSFRTNGSAQSRISSTGSYMNGSGANNSQFSPTDNGAIILRNVADSNPALIVNLANASATGNIQVWQKAGSAVAQIDNNGNGRFPVIANIASSNNSTVELTNNGATIYRNIADSNPSLIVSQVSSSSTGDILRLVKAGAIQASVATNGIANFTGTPSNAQTGDYTLVLDDKGKVLRINSSSNRTVTIPLNSSVAFPIDTEIAILRYGTGTVSISPTSGVTLNSVSSNRKVKDQYGSVALKKIGENEWVLVGSLEA